MKRLRTLLYAVANTVSGAVLFLLTRLVAGTFCAGRCFIGRTNQLPHQGPSSYPTRLQDTSPFCVRAPCGSFPSTKLQPGNGFGVVFRSESAGEVPPRPFGTSVA